MSRSGSLACGPMECEVFSLILRVTRNVTMRTATCLFLAMLFFGRAMSQDRLLPQQTVAANASRYIRFYPNPATTFINIEVQRNLSRNHSFQVYNFLGKKVAELADLSGRTRIDLTNFGRGIYIYQLKDASGKVVESGKFQVEK